MKISAASDEPTALIIGMPVAATRPGIATPALAQGPAVPSYGRIYPTEGAAQGHDPELDYRVVFDITIGASDPAKPNRSLEAVATLATCNCAAGRSYLVRRRYRRE